jgi:hypothetical protein
MRSLGFLLLIMGVGSFVLHAMNMEFRLLMWVDNWGVDTGNIIRIAAAVLGVILIALSFRKKPEVVETTTTTYTTKTD